MNQAPVSFAVKGDIRDVDAICFSFVAQKTMYRGKDIAVGDRVFIFASENKGGAGLFARGIATNREEVPRNGNAQQTPRVSNTVKRDGSAKSLLGRSQLHSFRAWSDGGPQTELNFKLYRQATNKIVGLTATASAFLESLF